MPSTTHKRYQAANDAAFLEFLLGWLASLPADGWRGSATDLFDAWGQYDTARAKREAKRMDAADAKRHREIVANPDLLPWWERPPHCTSMPKPPVPNKLRLSWFPRASAASKALMREANAIRAAGWHLKFTRTATARTITFKRARAK